MEMEILRADNIARDKIETWLIGPYLLFKVPMDLYEKWWYKAQAQVNHSMEGVKQVIRRELLDLIDRNFQGWDMVGFDDFSIETAAQHSTPDFTFTWGMYVLLTVTNKQTYDIDGTHRGDNWRLILPFLQGQQED